MSPVLHLSPQHPGFHQVYDPLLKWMTFARKLSTSIAPEKNQVGIKGTLATISQTTNIFLPLRFPHTCRINTTFQLLLKPM